MSDTLLKSFVEVRRNFADYPFVRTMLEADKSICVDRSTQVLEDLDSTWIHYPLPNIRPEDFERLRDQGHLDRSMLSKAPLSLFLCNDKDAALYVNEEDHLRIRFFAEGEDLGAAAVDAKALVKEFADRWPLAKSQRLGWLTARPVLAGTGIQAGYVLHLPMLTMMQQIKGLTASLTEKHLYSLTGLGGPEEKNPAALYLLQNQFSAWGSTQKLLDALRDTAGDIQRKEQNLRDKIISRAARSTYVDQVYRAYGILKYARRLTEGEFLGFWSKLRLGVLSGLLDVPLKHVDELLASTSRTALLEALPEGRDEHAIHFLRADAVRAILNGGT